MTETDTDAIEIQSKPKFIKIHKNAQQSDEFIFSYTIAISNYSGGRVQLLARRWLITNGNGKLTTVEGEGVVGEKPVIPDGESFCYTSGVSLETPVGIMQGSYIFTDHYGQRFETAIPAFRLAIPGIIN